MIVIGGRIGAQARGATPPDPDVAPRVAVAPSCGTSKTGDVAPARVLLFSLRGLDVQRWHCAGLEFEDVIAAIEDVETVVPLHRGTSRTRLALRRSLARALPPATLPASGLGVAPSQARYDMFFAVVGNLRDLTALDALPDWRRRSRVAACFLQEIFVSHLAKSRRRLEALRAFDVVFCACAGSVGPLQETLGVPVVYLPHAVDMLRFRPRCNFGQRPIDVTMIGRSSRVTHAALVEHTRRKGAFYYCDTTRSPRVWVDEPDVHRDLLANILKSSRFFIANSANFDRQDKMRDQEELGARFFEGAAGGAVILGSPPRTTAFADHLGWPESVLPLPVHCPEIGSVMEELLGQPERLAEISRRNVVNCARRHDWSHRWTTVLDRLELGPTPAALLRSAELARISQGAVA